MIVDFHNSFLEWETPDGSLGKFNAEAVVFLKDQSFILGSEVIACNVYNEENFFKRPVYKFQPLFSKEKQIIFRTFTDTQSTYDSVSHLKTEFKNITCHLQEIPSRQYIDNYKELVKAYKKNANFQVLVKTENYEMQFPVKHFNLNIDKEQFQVETGPVIILDEDDEPVRAFAAFSSFGGIEFILERDINKKRVFDSTLLVKTKIELIIENKN